MIERASRLTFSSASSFGNPSDAERRSIASRICLASAGFAALLALR
jgi:hypothetical protein